MLSSILFIFLVTWIIPGSIIFLIASKIDHKIFPINTVNDLIIAILIGALFGLLNVVLLVTVLIDKFFKLTIIKDFLNRKIKW